MQTSTSSSSEILDKRQVSEESIRLELNRIINSRTFQQADRLQRFLAFIVEETLSGQADSLKEYQIGVEVFGKESSFDPRLDPIVRVQARRLRIRLTAYYRAEASRYEVIIELPKGGYAPIFRPSAMAAQTKCATAGWPSPNTVQVLQFLDHSEAGDQKYFCAALSNAIVTSLSQNKLVTLVSGGFSQELDKVESVLPAAMIVSGSIRRSKDMQRITIHLSDAMHGCFIWSHTIDRNPENEIAIQEEVIELVLHALYDELARGATGRGWKRQTQNLAAHNMYLQGRYHLNQRTEQGLRKAVDFFSGAIAEDPQLAQAYAGAADAHSLLAHYGVAAPAEVWAKAASNATQAVITDDESAEAHTSLAHVRATQDWDWSGAEREFQRAIFLNPSYSTAHHWYAMSCLAPLGRFEEALDELRIAGALDPTSSIIAREIALVHYYHRNFELALEQCDHTIEKNPHFSAAYWTLGLIQEQRGDFDEAVAAFQRAIQLSPPSPRILGALGRTFAISGKTEEAFRILRQLDSLAAKRYISPFELALIHFALERIDEGFQLLTKAYEDRCFELIAIKVDPRFDSVKQDPRFIALFTRLGLP